MMECPNCKMSIKGGSSFCIHCGARLNNMGMNPAVGQPLNAGQSLNAEQPLNVGQPQPMGNQPIANQPVNGTVQNNAPINNAPAVQQPVQSEPVTYENVKSRILVTLPALGILIVYSYIIISLTALGYAYIKLLSAYSSSSVFSSLFSSEEVAKIVIKYVGTDLLLIVSFILTVLHKKFMGFVAIFYSVIVIVYDIVKLKAAVLPIVVGLFVIACAIIYLSEEDPV